MNVAPTLQVPGLDLQKSSAKVLSLYSGLLLVLQTWSEA
jgi:hypothetical protein